MPSGTTGPGFIPRWEHFGKLSFLDDYDVEIETASNVKLPTATATSTEQTSGPVSAGTSSQVSYYAKNIYCYYFFENGRHNLKTELNM